MSHFLPIALTALTFAGLSAVAIAEETTNATTAVDTEVFAAADDNDMIQLQLRPRKRGDHDVLPEDLWAIDTSRSGDFCYTNQSQLSLWRAEANKAWMISIKNHATQEEIQLRWPAGQTQLPWPVQKMPLAANTPYMIEVPGALRTFSMHEVTTTSANIENAALLQQFNTKNCEQQANVLVKMIQTP